MTAGRSALTSRHYVALTTAYVLFVVYGSLVPLHVQHVDLPHAWDRFAREVFRAPTLGSRSDWVANVLLFVPLGFVAAGAAGVDRRRPLAILAVVPAMTVLSAALEFAQVWFPGRYPSVNDVIGETAGGIIGVLAWVAIGQRLTDRVRSAWTSLGPGDWAAKVVPVYLAFLVLAHGMPFDLTLSPWQIHRKYRHGLEPDAELHGIPRIGLAPHPARAAEAKILNLAYFVPVGCLLARLPGGRWRQTGALGRIVTVGVVIAAGIEALQVIVLSRSSYASDVPIVALFVLAGWWLATRPPMRAWAWGVVAFGWITAVAVALGVPFDGRPGDLMARLREIEWQPFAEQVAGGFLSGFSRLLDKAVLLAPVGFLLVRAGMPAWAATTTGALASAGVAIGQAAMTTHRPNLSDVVMGAIGAGAGSIVAKYVRRQHVT